MSAWETASAVITNLLLFLLVMGMSATVDIRNMKSQLRNWRAILTGLFCQFVMLPFFGFCVVKIFDLPPEVGITLLVIVASPGGSYSNWWCSLLNADLALSVAMTTASTILSCAFLPANLMLWTHLSYGGATQDGKSIMEGLNFGIIFISIAVVIVAIAAGMFCSAKFDNAKFHKGAYIGGNVSGIALILFSVILSFTGGGGGADPSDVKGQEPKFYFSVTIPVLLGLIGASIIASCTPMSKPERLTTAVECCYQNTGIATSAAVTLFSGDELQNAMRVPLIYGIAEIILIGLYLIIFWKLGWSKAPRKERFCKVITKSYEMAPKDDAEGALERGGKTFEVENEEECKEQGQEVELGNSIAVRQDPMGAIDRCSKEGSESSNSSDEFLQNPSR